MKTVLDLSLSSNWEQICDQTFVAQEQAGGYIPIPIFELSTLVDSPILAVNVTSTKAKNTWKFGGILAQRYQIGSPGSVSPLPHVDVSFVSLRVNRSRLVVFEHIDDEYTLRYEPPTYFKDVRLKIWKYTGEISDSISEYLETMKVDLVRIESKIDQLLVP